MLEFLRRFGLEYCDLPTMVGNVAFLLRTCLINIEKKYTQRIPIICYVTQIFGGVSYFYVYQASMIWYLCIRYHETKDLIATSVIFSLGTCSMTGIAKLFYMRIHIETIKDLVNEYLDFNASVDPTTRFYINLLKALRDIKRRALKFWSFVIFNGVVYILIPIILPGRHLIEDLIVIYGLEPTFESPNYEIAYMMMAAGIYFGIPAETNTSTFFIILTGYIEAQILALSQELDNLWEDANTLSQEYIVEGDGNNNHIVLNAHIRMLLRDVVTKHIKNIKLLRQVEKIFRKAMAIEFAFLTSGLISELLGGLENTYLQLPYTLIQVAMDCFIGQRLIDASLVLTNAIYNCNWEKFDASNQKTIYLMLLNSQNNLTLSVGGLTVLNFSYLMSVLKSIYSAYTTLRTRM